MNKPMDNTYSDNELLSWLALLRAPNIGCRTLNPLIAKGHSPTALFQKAPTETPEKLHNYLRSPDWQQAEKDLVWLKESGNQLLPITNPDYPSLLKALSDPPTALFLKGDPLLLHLPQIAMVGSRSASRGGLETAQQFASHLASSGLVITSGLALGVDSAAHKGALQTQGKTIAVLGTGLDRVYPARNRDLAHQIAEHGLLVSEYLPGTPPLQGNFPRRNRIIAGLSVGTLVVEAALKSGSLITARLAAETGREVFAIPGSIHNPMARGCHALIREGAKLVETSEHLAEELASQLSAFSANQASPIQTNENPEIEPDHQTLLDAMGYDPVSTDQIVARSGFSAAETSSMLLLLELQGHVSSEAGGVFTRLEKAR